MTYNINLYYFIYINKYNNNILNKFNLVISISQLANINITLYINAYTIIKYISKYYNKIKIKIKSYKEILNKVLFLVSLI